MEPDYLEQLEALLVKAEKNLERDEYVAFVGAAKEAVDEAQDEIDSADLDD